MISALDLPPHPSLIEFWDLSRIQAVSCSTIRDLDRRINDVETELNSGYKFVGPTPEGAHPIRTLKSFMIKLCICQERLRLHRPYQTRSYSDDETFGYSRRVCISAAEDILAIHSSPLCEAAWAGLSYKVRCLVGNLYLVFDFPDLPFFFEAICASIVLAIDLLHAPGPDAQSTRESIQNALGRVERYSKISVSFSPFHCGSVRVLTQYSGPNRRSAAAGARFSGFSSTGSTSRRWSARTRSSQL